MQEGFSIDRGDKTARVLMWTEGRPAFPIRIWIQKDGYKDPPGLPKTTPPNPSGAGWREVVINGDTRFDAELARQK